MNRYRTEIDLKVGIDRTQMRYHCCGALSYEDWFQIAWIDVEYLDKFDSEVSKYAAIFFVTKIVSVLVSGYGCQYVSAADMPTDLAAATLFSCCM